MSSSSLKKNNSSFLNKTILGIIFYCIGMFITTFISVFVKKTMLEYKLPSWEVVFIREIFVIMTLFPFMIKYKFKFFQKNAFGLNLFRNILYFLSTILFYQVITKLPMNTCISIEFLVPVIAGIFAMIFLKEKGTKMTWIALLICIFGALIVKTPSFSSDGEFYAYLLLIVVILLRGGIICCNGKLASIFNTSSIMFYSNIMLFLMSAMFFTEFIKPHPMAIFILGIAGLLYCLEYFLIFTAHKWCTVLTLQPCEFSKMLFSIILSYVVLGEQTTQNQIIGSLVIVIGFSVMIFGKKYIETKKTKINGLK